MTKPILHQIHPVLPVQNVVETLSFYVNILGFSIAFADDSKQPHYAGIRKDHIEIHLQQHDVKEWEHTVHQPMLRIVTENIELLYKELKQKNVFHENTKLRETVWGTREFAFFDNNQNGLTFYQNL